MLELTFTFKQKFGAITQFIFVTLRILIMNLLFQRHGNVLGGLEDAGFDSGRGKRFFPFSKMSIPYTTSIVVGTLVFFFPKELNRPGRKVSHLPSSGTKFKNEWKYNFNFPVCLQIVERKILHVYFLIHGEVNTVV